MSKTQRELNAIAHVKNEAYYQYTLYCYESKTIPSKADIFIIDVCQDVKTLKGIRDKYVQLIAEIEY